MSDSSEEASLDTVTSEESDIEMYSDVDSDESSHTEESVNENQPAADSLDDFSHVLRNHLEVLLRLAAVDFKGTFSFHKTYTNAPNPGLHLSDLGVVGLPLSRREAEIVKSKCAQAPFGKGERTLIDKRVRDTWQMDASQVNFGHPQWSEFLSRVVKEVCQALGVNYLASQPQCELHKLLLYEHGSHFLPHVDTEKQDGMFATIVVVLPSAFSGGAAHLSHGGKSVVFDCSATSQHETNVLAWYTDVTHEIKPITDGYRLALSYNLVHTTKSLRPALSGNEDLVNRLRDRLMTWKTSKDGHCPKKLVYLLNHTYSRANLCASALKGVDAHRVAILDPLAQELGFRLGLASIECHQFGPATEDGDFAYMSENTITIKCFKDMDGTRIRGTLDFDNKTETIPADLTGTITKRRADESELHEAEYQGNEAGDLERWYRRSVLVIWPTSNDYSVLYGKQALRCALADLKTITTLSGCSSEQDLLEYVLSCIPKEPIAVTHALTDMCLIWNNTTLWNQTVKAASAVKGLQILNEERVQQAAKQFGLDVVKPGIQEMLDRDTSNTARIEFLNRFQEWANGLTDDTLEKTMLQEWSITSKTNVLATLKAPREADSEQSLLLSIAVENGGIEYMNSYMVPQLVSVADGNFLRQFAMTVHQSTVFPDCDTKSAAVSSLFAAAIARECFFGPPSAPDFYTPGPDYLELAKVYIKAAEDLGLPHLVNSVIDRITDTSKLDATQTRECATTVMIPLTIFFGQRRSQQSPGSELPASFVHLQRVGIKLSLVEELRTDDIGSIVDASLAGGTSTGFVEFVWSPIATQSVKLGTGCLQTVIRQLKAKRDNLVSSGMSSSSVQAIIETLATRVASCIYLQRVEPDIIQALNWCAENASGADLCNIIVKRVLENVDSISPDDLDWRLAAASGLHRLQIWGVQHQRDMNSVIQKIVTAWVERFLGAPPAVYPSVARHVAALAKWTCSCDECSRTREFLTRVDSYYVESKSFNYDGPHALKKLAKYARNLAAWTQTGRTFLVTKCDDMRQWAGWKWKLNKGLTILQSLSTDENELRHILGSEYERVKAALSEPQPEAPAELQTAASDSAATSASGASAEGSSTSTTAATSDAATTMPASKKRKIAADDS